MDCCCQQLSLTLWLWVTVPAAAVCSAGLIPHAIFHEYIPLIRNQNLFQLCLFLSSSALSLSIHQPPTKTYYSLFPQTNTVWKCSCFSFHACEQTSESLHCFHTPSSCLPTKLFWDVSRDNPELCSSVPENVRSWLYYEHLPKIGHQRLLHPPNAASSGCRCALYCQNIKKKIHLCADTDIKHNTSHFCWKKRKGGWYCMGVAVSTHGIVPAQLHQWRITPLHVPASQSSPAEMLWYMSPVVAWFFSLKGLCWWEMESERPAVNSSASPRIAPVGEQRLINGVWAGDDGPLTEIHISCNGVNPGCSCLCYCLSYMILLKAGAQPCMFGPPWENRDVVWSQLSGSLLKFIFASRLHWGFQACWWPPGLIEFRRIKGITCKITQWQFPVGKAPGLRLVLGTH